MDLIRKDVVLFDKCGTGGEATESSYLTGWSLTWKKLMDAIISDGREPPCEHRDPRSDSMNALKRLPHAASTRPRQLARQNESSWSVGMQIRDTLYTSQMGNCVGQDRNQVNGISMSVDTLIFRRSIQKRKCVEFTPDHVTFSA